VPLAARGGEGDPRPALGEGEAVPPPAGVALPPASSGVAVGAGAVLYYRSSRSRKIADASTRVESFGQALLGGPWSLVDATGRPVTSGDFHGKYVLLYFGFTFCPDICPNELVKMARVVDAVDKVPGLEGQVVPLFVSLDPHRDTCAQVGAYCADFHPRMVGLTGTPGQIKKVAKTFRVFFSEVDRVEGDSDEENEREEGAGATGAAAPAPAAPPPLPAAAASGGKGAEHSAPQSPSSKVTHRGGKGGGGAHPPG
jgi:cytochrome oxidase Cu insertion factor (SCO1/SenC/PrrC family)